MTQDAWFVILGVFFIVWIIFYLKRKKGRYASPVFGIVSLIAGFLVEIFAVSQNLWNYTGGNWPLILWPTYFMAGMMVFEVADFLGRRFLKE